MQHDPILVEETAAWLRRATNDLAAAEHDLQAEPPLLGDIAFHAQQAAEKAMKAFLTWHCRPLRKTHNLVELGEQCVAIDTTLESLLRRAAPLTEYAWKFRYPGPLEDPSGQEAQHALETAHGVYKAIVERLPADVHP